MSREHTFPTSTWNAGRIVGPKPPLKPRHIWAIRQQLKNANRIRDLALFNCAIDAKLRGCDLVKLRLSDLAPGGSLRQRATVVQQKTGRPVLFEITEPAREALAAWLALRGRRDDDWIFPSRSRPGEHLSIRQYARLVGEWVAMIDLEPTAYGTHSLRRTKVAWSTSALATCAPASCYWGTESWRAQSDTSGSRSTTRWRCRSKRRSESDCPKPAVPNGRQGWKPAVDADALEGMFRSTTGDYGSPEADPSPYPRAAGWRGAPALADQLPC
jgi:integrase